MDNSIFTQQQEQPTPAKGEEKKTTTTAVAEKPQSTLPAQLKDLAGALAAPKKSFIAAGGTEEEFAREVNFAAQALMKNDFLLNCAKKDPQYLVEAIKNVGLTKLTLNPELRMAYLVPFKGKIQMMSSYMGKVEILRRTGAVKDIYADLVYEKDTFEFEKGLNAKLVHKPAVFAKDRGELLGGYYYAKLSDGSVQFDVMPVSRIEEIKSRSESVKKGGVSPWSTDYTEMAKKTILNWAFKFLPKSDISDKMLQVLEAENTVEREEFEAWKENIEQEQNKYNNDSKPIFIEAEEV